MKFTEAATTDPVQVREWLTLGPRNVGIYCGKSGILVIDEDKPGELARYAADHHVQVPRTLTVSTGKGTHYYFRARLGLNLGNQTGKFSDYAIDVRAGNGYVVAPGSLHASGVVYTIEQDMEPCPVPDWVIDAVQSPATTRAAQDQACSPSWDGQGQGAGLTSLPSVIRGPREDRSGQRHHFLMRYASSLRSRDTPIEEARILLRRAWERCEQPPDCDDKLPWEEARATLEDIYARYAPGTGRPSQPGGSGAGADIPGRQARLTKASDIQARPVVWAWKDGLFGRIPSGSLSMAAGREGTGKSSFGIWLAAHSTQGTLPGSYFGRPRNVFYVAVEDFWSYTLVPRLTAAGADLDRVYRLDVVNVEGEEMTMSLPHDNGILEQQITEHDVALVVIDPIMSALADRINASHPKDVRSALDPLTKIADRTGCVVLGIAHFNKARSSDPTLLISESKAFTDVMYCHALPQGWEHMDYEEFLAARRSLMAQVTRDAYTKLSGGLAEPVEPTAATPEPVQEPPLRELVERDLLRPGDLLDPVDPEWEVDAVINDDGTLVIDGTELFDSLDEAAHYLEVTNMSGLQFWALETDKDLVPLHELISIGRS